MDNIHDTHGGLPPDERNRLNENAGNQEQIILQILRGNPRKRFAYFDIIKITGYDKDSAKRSLSNLSGSAPHDRYKDGAGRWPVSYDARTRKPNPNTGVSCGTYQANPNYGDPTGQASQGDMFGAPEDKHQPGIML